MLIYLIPKRITTLVEGGLYKRSDSRRACYLDLKANKQGKSTDDEPDDSITIIKLEVIGKLFLGILYFSIINLIVLIIELVNYHMNKIIEVMLLYSLKGKIIIYNTLATIFTKICNL